MRFVRSILVDDVTPSADGTYSYDLPINPLSHIILTFKVLNNAAKATLAQILGAIENITVEFRGQAIISLNGADLFALNCILYGHEPVMENVVDTDDATRSITLFIPFGRRIFNPNECMFAVNRGDLKLKIQVDIADTGYDGSIFQVETVELLEASPSQYLKVTTLSDTPAATGDMDEDLPIGNLIAGILLWGTTIPTGTSWTTTLNKVRLLIDNVENGYANANWESLHGDLLNLVGAANAFAEKFHTENTAASYAQNADTAAEEADDSDISNYAFMDYGIGIPDDFLLETEGKSRVHLRINAGDTNAFRALPLELVKV